MKNIKIHSVIIIVTTVLVLTQNMIFAQALNFYAKKDFKAGDTPYWSATGDLNGDSYEDIVVVNAGGSGNSVSVYFNIMLDKDPVFTDKTDFAVGGNPVYVAIADINRDGKPDIITANGNTNDVSVLINKTDNNSLTPVFEPAYNFNTGNRPVGVAIADLNNDSLPDIVTSNYYGENVSVLLNKTPAGNDIPVFSEKTDLAVGTAPIELSLPDINGDGKADIVTANINTNTISIFINKTDSGAVVPQFGNKEDFSTGYNPTSLSSVDINGDGKPDLVTSNFAGQSVTVLLNKTAAGSAIPAFAEKKDFSTSGNPHALSTGDLNKDGKPDIALANYYLNSVSVLVNKTSKGDSIPSMASEVSFASGRTPNTVLVTSLNNEPYMITSNLGDNSISVLTHNSLDLSRYLEPFWAADTIYDETLLPLSVNGGVPGGKLLYNAKKIISVKDAYIQKEYTEGKDWIYNNGSITLPEGSSAPYMNDYELVFNTAKTDSSLPGKTSGTYVFYREGYFQSKQLAVTYIPERDETRTALVPVSADKVLVNTIAKLKSKRPLKIVYLGDSIMKGANSSGFMGTSPFMPVWPDLVTYNLQNHFNTQIDAVNNAVGGTMSQWGAENIDQLVVKENPDLVILGFGMNDGGTAMVSKALFKRNMKIMIDAIKANNPNAEIILISTMVANPESIVDQLQETYKPVLDAFAGEGIVVADITAMHKELLKTKKYQDMSGNNINHPNDYLARWYAQYISGMLINESVSGVTDNDKQIPGKYTLYQNYPNPFNPETEIKYSIPEAAKVTLKIYNLLGEEVATLVNSEQNAGTYKVHFNASSLASGVYLYKIQAGSFISAKKLILLK
jgi:lysophospholipase L1-like esterase